LKLVTGGPFLRHSELALCAKTNRKVLFATVEDATRPSTSADVTQRSRTISTIHLMRVCSNMKPV